MRQASAPPDGFELGMNWGNRGAKNPSAEGVSPIARPPAETNWGKPPSASTPTGPNWGKRIGEMAEERQVNIAEIDLCIQVFIDLRFCDFNYFTFKKKGSGEGCTN